jgi:hypothetical protein
LQGTSGSKKALQIKESRAPQMELIDMHLSIDSNSLSNFACLLVDGLDPEIIIGAASVSGRVSSNVSIKTAPRRVKNSSSNFSETQNSTRISNAELELGVA